MVKKNLKIENLDGYAVEIELGHTEEDEMKVDENFILSLIMATFKDLKALGFQQKFQLHMNEHDKTNASCTWRVSIIPVNAAMENGPTWFVDTESWDYEAYHLKHPEDDYKGYFGASIVMPGIPSGSGYTLNPASSAIMKMVFVNYVKQIDIHYPDWRTNYNNGPKNYND